MSCLPPEKGRKNTTQGILRAIKFTPALFESKPQIFGYFTDKYGLQSVLQFFILLNGNFLFK